MARGPSGRVVIEMDPELKRELHAALVADGSTLKEWFISQARLHLRARREPALPGFGSTTPIAVSIAADDNAPYQVTKPVRTETPFPPTFDE